MATVSTLAKSSLAIVDDEQRKRCVSCNASRPRDGKLLHCLHVICLSCLNDSIREPGCVKCALCGETTTSLRHIHLSQQLADCCPLLYSVEDRATGSVSTPLAAVQKKLCEYCADNDVEKEVTHQCLDCVGELMCERHAQRHVKRPAFTGHRVIELSAAGEQINVTKASRSCPLHTNHVLEKYCVTCQCSVCERCLATGHHQQHNVQTVAETAASLREQLKQSCTASSSSVAAAASAGDSVSQDTGAVQPVTAMINALSAEVADVKQSAKISSQKVTETLSKVRKIVDKIESRLLADIDAKSWKTVEPLEMQCQQLKLLQLKETTGAELVKYLSSEESSDAEVVELSHIVTENLEHLSSDVKKEAGCGAHCGTRILVAADTERLQELERILETLVSVSCCSVDLAVSNVIIPDRTTVDKINKITLQPCDSQREPVSARSVAHSLVCTLVSPSGGRSSSSIECRCDDTAVEQTVDITIHPKEVGLHCLEMEYGEQKRSLEFKTFKTAAGAHVRFDPAKCSSRIRLSNSDGVATLVDMKGKVLAVEGYTAGSHRWSVNVTRCTAGNFMCGVGTTRLDGNYDAKPTTVRCAVSFGWFSAGACLNTGCESTPPWRDGDILTFTLDCDAKTLELHHHRSNTHMTIDDVDCSKPLYPLLHLYAHGQEAEFLSTTV